MNNIQKQVDDWINSPGHIVNYFPKDEIITQILEECGEVGREISHLHGHKKKKTGEVTDGLECEIGDVFFALCCLANSEGMELVELEEMSKVTSMLRYPDYFSRINYIIKNLGKLTEALDFTGEDLEGATLILTRIMSSLCNIALLHSINPVKAFEKSMAKKTGRDKDRFKK